MHAPARAGARTSDAAGRARPASSGEGRASPPWATPPTAITAAASTAARRHRAGDGDAPRHRRSNVTAARRRRVLRGSRSNTPPGACEPGTGRLQHLGRCGMPPATDHHAAAPPRVQPALDRDQPDQALRRRRRRRRPDLRARAGQHHRFPRPQRRRQDDDAAASARPRRAHGGHGRSSSAGPTGSSRTRSDASGAVLESGDFDPGRSGRNHLRALALAAEIRFDRVEEVLALVELTAAAARPVRTYSLGMRQRLGLAGALLGDPGAAGPRRARQRPRPGGRALAARLPAPVRATPAGPS